MVCAVMGAVALIWVFVKRFQIIVAEDAGFQKIPLLDENGKTADVVSLLPTRLPLFPYKLRAYQGTARAAVEDECLESAARCCEAYGSPYWHLVSSSSAAP